MSQAEEILTILFADISGSTSLYESLGDDAAHSIIEECLSMLAVTARLHDGEIIWEEGNKTIITKTEQPKLEHESVMNIVSGEKKVYVDSLNPSINIGRQNTRLLISFKRKIR